MKLIVFRGTLSFVKIFKKCGHSKLENWVGQYVEKGRNMNDHSAKTILSGKNYMYTVLYDAKFNNRKVRENVKLFCIQYDKCIYIMNNIFAVI